MNKKVLRVGIIQNGKIVEEKMFRKNQPITLGEHVNNTFHFPGVGFKEQFPVFMEKDGKRVLTFCSVMDGRVHIDGSVQTFQHLIQSKKAIKVGKIDMRPYGEKKQTCDVYQLPLPQTSRGKIKIGELTILFQFVTPPPMPEKLVIPDFLQGSWRVGIPWGFAAILVGSFLFHLGLVFWFYKQGPMPEKLVIENISSRWIPIVATAKPIPRIPMKKKVPKEKTNKRVSKKNKPKNRGDKVAKKRDTKTKKQHKIQRRKQNLDKINNSGMLAVIGVKKPGESGSLRDVMNSGVIDKASRYLKGLKRGGLQVAYVKKPGNTKELRNQQIRVGNHVAGMPSNNPTINHVRRRATKLKPTFMKIRRIKTEPGTLSSPSSLMRLLRRKKYDLQSCYNREVSKNRSLKGKILFLVEIGQNRRLASIEIEENQLNSKVGRCLVRKLKKWRWPKPASKENAEVRIPLFFGT